MEANQQEVSMFILKRIVPIIGIGPFPFAELSLMVSAVCFLRPKYICEWGTHVGKSARVFSETVRVFSLPTMIHSIDLPDDVYHEEHPGSMRGIYVRNCSNVVLHQGDGVEVSKSILRSVRGGAETLFFLDGDHAYESVYRELSVLTSLYSRAWILVHDTFNQVRSSGYNTGPYRAVRRIMKQKSLSIFQVNYGLPGMTLLIPNKL